MPATTKKRPVNDVRRGLLSKVHVAKKQLGLSDEDYRAMLEKVTGKDSAKACSYSELEKVVSHCEHDLGWKPKKTAPARAAAKRPLADGEEARKCRALWLSLYHLGVVRDPSETALERFLERQSGGRGKGVAKLQWMRSDQALKVIEALKKMAERDAGVDWSGYRDPISGGVTYNPRRRVAEAQWLILRKADAAPAPQLLDHLRQVTGRVGWWDSSPDQIDRLIEDLGARVRAVRGT